MDDIPIGENIYWYENGYKKGTAFIINGLPTGERCWNEDGIECECKGYFWDGCSGSTMAKMDGPCRPATSIPKITLTLTFYSILIPTSFARGQTIDNKCRTLLVSILIPIDILSYRYVIHISYF
jgi:hypothetical protein